MIKAAELDAEIDLALLSRWLRKREFPHRIAEENGKQVLWVAHESHVQDVNNLLHQFLSDPDVRQMLNDQVNAALDEPRPVSASVYPRPSWRQAPFVFMALILSIILAITTSLGEGGPVLRALLIVNPFDYGGSLSTFDARFSGLMFTLYEGQVWRLVTPDFIHFSILHITFNMLFLWLFGGLIEQGRGTIAFFGLFLFVSIISNIGQLLATGHLFGGMSGVVYGIIGYCWLWSVRQPGVLQFPDVLLKFSIVWLLIGYTPLTEWLGLGAMANTAHLLGLLSGLLWGVITLEIKKDP